MSKLVNFTGMKNLSTLEMMAILERADYWAKQTGVRADVLNGRFVANLFLEPSTRTRFSFEVAEKRLGANVLNFNAESSSTTKGETMYDTLKTLESMGVEAAVIRTRENHLIENMAEQVGLAIVNAGDGTNEHPTQCFLDLLTMKQQFGQLAGLKVAIAGDLLHSRVVGSHLQALPRLGAKLMLSGPDVMLRPKSELPAGVEIVDFDEAVSTADVVMMLRVQLERHDHKLFESQEAYHQAYGLTLQRERMMKPGAIIMHPAPVNRGVEIHTDLVECERSVIFKQVTNGVAVRMAVLEYAMNGGVNAWQSSLETVSA